MTDNQRPAISIIHPQDLQRIITLTTPVGAGQAPLPDNPYSIVDTRPQAAYLAGHIPGAVWIGWEAWCEQCPAHAGPELKQPGYWGVLQDIPSAELAQRLAALGLNSQLPIIVYADGPRSKGREGRVAWMLLYWGASHLYLLDGGWSAWLRHGGSSEQTIPEPQPGQFNVALQEHRRVRLSQLRVGAALGSPLETSPLLIDVRSRHEFAGRNYAYQPRTGRLPGATHIPFTSLFNSEDMFLDKEAYRELLPETVLQARSLVAYCEVGVRSCVFALLHEIYTGQVVANFDGSVMEWSLDPTLPMV